MAEGVTTLTDATFDEEIASAETPVVVDFWAEWCGPCKQIAPALEEIAAEHAGKVTIAKINIDDHPQASIRYGVQSIPTLIVFADGQEKKRLVGARPKRALLEELAEFL